MVRCELDGTHYPAGIKIADAVMRAQHHHRQVPWRMELYYQPKSLNPQRQMFGAS
jgi:hypothetical protein